MAEMKPPSAWSLLLDWETWVVGACFAVFAYIGILLFALILPILEEMLR